MELRVLVVLCVLACLAVPLSAQIIPGEAARESAAGNPGDTPGACGEVFVTVTDAVPETASVYVNSAIAWNSGTNSLPQVVVLERTGNVYLVRNVEVQATVKANHPIPVAGPGTDRHTLAPGGKRFFAAPVRNGAPHHWVDIGWDASAGEITLLVYPPDGCLGPYTDADDGVIDGRIFLDISSPDGLAPGGWYYEVGRSGGSGPMEFTFETYG